MGGGIGSIVPDGHNVFNVCAVFLARTADAGSITAASTGFASAGAFLAAACPVLPYIAADAVNSSSGYNEKNDCCFHERFLFG